jgi:hypothetical protein
VSVSSVGARVLIGWFERDSAVRFLTNECVFAKPLDAAEAEAIWTPYRERVEALPDRAAAIPTPLTLNEKEKIARAAFLKQHSAAPNIKDVIKVDPMGLVVHQWIVVTDRSDTYKSKVATVEGWINATIAATTKPQQVQLKIGLNAMDVEVPHGEFVINFSNTGFQITELAKFVSVTKFAQRMMLHAGYHRSYARISGMAPDAIDRSVLVVDTTDGEFLVSPSSPNQGVRAVCCGLRPALFGDFFDDRFFINVPVKRKRFVLQVRGQMVPVDAREATDTPPPMSSNIETKRKC